MSKYFILKIKSQSIQKKKTQENLILKVFKGKKKMTETIPREDQTLNFLHKCFKSTIKWNKPKPKRICEWTIKGNSKMTDE